MDQDLGDNDAGGWSSDVPPSAPSSISADYSSFSPVENYTNNCEYLRAAGDSAGSTDACYVRNPRTKSGRKETELRCDVIYNDELTQKQQDEFCKDKRVKKGNVYVEEEEAHWNYTYRILDPTKTKVLYVGITSRSVQQRCAEHGVRISDTNDLCQFLMVVPNRGVALGVQQFLMEVYGFGSGSTANLQRNFDYSTGLARDTGWFNNRAPSLRNKRRNISASISQVCIALSCMLATWRLICITRAGSQRPLIHGTRRARMLGGPIFLRAADAVPRGSSLPPFSTSSGGRQLAQRRVRAHNNR